MFPLAELARQHRKLVLPISVRPSFERHEVDKRRYDHALQVIQRFDAAKIGLIEISTIAAIRNRVRNRSRWSGNA